MKKAEPRDIKLVADCQFDCNSLIETSDRPGRSTAAASKAHNHDDSAVVSTSVAG